MYQGNLSLDLPSVERGVVAYESPREKALVIEGGASHQRETLNWQVGGAPPDRAINTVKEEADGRATDMILNDGYARGAIQSHMDGIVGAQYRLNSKIVWRAIPGATEAWAKETQRIIEERFSLVAESTACYLDAAGMNTFTGMIRLAVASFVISGEVLATSEWDKTPGRPCKTCFQMVSPSRLRNPDWSTDTQELRRGVKVNQRGKPLGYYIMRTHPYSFYYDADALAHPYIPAAKPWGRPQVFHVIEQLFPDQHRGIADMVAALKKMKMTKHFQEVTLQNAVINATYAAAIESEAPTAEMITAMGGGDADGYQNALGAWLTGLTAYLKGAENITLDGGAMIPHLYPGTKLNLKTLGTPGGVGTDFEDSLLRHIAASLNMNREEFLRDYRGMSYASARLSDSKTVRFMEARKKMVADRVATGFYINWVEEEIAAGNIPLPPGQDRDIFYMPLVKEALTRCSWIGSGRGQIDELKETQAAIMRIKAGLSTYEKEIARFGDDYRDVFEQAALEQGLIKERGLLFDLSSSKGNTGQGGGSAQDGQQAAEDAAQDVADDNQGTD